MKEIFYKTSAWISVLPVFLAPKFALAENDFQGYKGLGTDGSQKSLSTVKTAAKLDQAGDLPTLIGRLINGFLGILGIIFVLLVVYAGIMYMTAAGDDVKVKKAKTLLVQAIIGIIIIVAAYSISAFVIGQITTVSTG